MADCISRDKAIETVINYEFENCPDYMRDFATKLKSAVCSDIRTGLQALPAADVVARDCYDRILAENDTMREQLAQVGKKPGDKMDDVWRFGADMEGNENG